MAKPKIYGANINIRLTSECYESLVREAKAKDTQPSVLARELIAANIK